MYKKIQTFIYSTNDNTSHLNADELLNEISLLCTKAFVHKEEAALLEAHRVLYVINTASLSTPWVSTPHNLAHPLISQIKYQLETSLETAERAQYHDVLTNMPMVSDFSSWIKQFVSSHRSNSLHEIFNFLSESATFEQMREFFFQESPLEMLFGDILAFMLPGVYGGVKIEFLKNYWDEVGHANDERVHRNLRAKLMDHLQIKRDAYLTQFELLVREELELINLYLSLAINRAKHTQLVGVMLATELMIPNRFKYSIDGWKRLGVPDDVMVYLIEHTTVDEVHAEDWLMHVVLPIIEKNPEAHTDIMLGVLRRLTVSVAVLDKLYAKIKQIEVASIGAFEGSLYAECA